MRFLSFIYCLVFGLITASAQPPLNEWYDLGMPQSVYSYVVSTDSCYYSLGQATNPLTPGSFDVAFSKTKLDGSLEFVKFLHSDTASYNSFYSCLVPTYDDHFVTVVLFDNYFSFIKYTPNGDTVFTSTIQDLFLNESLNTVYATTFLEVESDSSYSGLISSQHSSTGEMFVTFVNIDRFGDLNYYEHYPMGLADYSYYYARDMVKTDYGYLISSDVIKAFGGALNDRKRVRLLKVDDMGNLIEEWTDMVHEKDVHPYGVQETSDGGMIYGGQSGWYYAPLNTELYVAHIVKLNSDFSLDWEIRMQDTTSSSFTSFDDVLEIDEYSYVASGYTAKDSMIVGWLFSFDVGGSALWDSYFSYVPATGAIAMPRHEFYDIERTEDNGFIMAGQAWDKDLTNAGQPGRFAWLVKTDSVGCLVPGCQDFFGIEENQTTTVKLSLYPNPTSDVLNIYFYDQTFTGKATMQVYDLQGKLLRTWPIGTNDITFMYDVSALAAGTYILKVVDGGVEKTAVKFIKN